MLTNADINAMAERHYHERDNFKSCHAHTSYENGCELFYSYKTLVAVKDSDRLYFNEKDYTRTTSKQLTQWSGLTSKARKDGIKHGIFKTFKLDNDRY